MIRFKVTDNSKNRKNVVVLTEGIDSSKYNENNVFLYNHNYEKPIGVSNYFTEGNEGFADVYFDEEDPFAMSIKSKIEKGHLKAASIGIGFNKEDLKLNEDNVIVINKCELREISVTPVPANSNAMVQLSDEGNLIDDGKETDILHLSADIVITEVDPQINLNKDNMNFESFNVKDESELLEKFNTLESGLTEKDIIISELNDKAKVLDTEVEGLNLKLSAFEGEVKSRFIDDAITAGKFNADQRESLIKLSADNYELVKEMIEKAVEVKKPTINLNDKITKKDKNTEDVSTWTFSDWINKDYEGLDELRTKDKDKYDALYLAHTKK